MDFGTILRTSARDHPGNLAVRCEGRDQTHAQMFARACRLANALSRLGARPGDRVALLGDNCLETVEQIAGIALGNLVRAALYAHQPPEVNAYLLELVEARVLIVQARLHAALAPLLGGLGALETVVVYGGDAPAGTLAYEDLLTAASPEDPRVPIAAGDVHVIRFSAGTTGRPKGIVHTVEGWLGLGNEYRWVTPQLDERDRYLAAGPLTHAAVIFLWPMLQVGASVVVMPAFDPGRALELIESERITFTLMVPTMIQALVAHPAARSRDLSSLRCVNYAAAPISEATLTAAVDVLGEVLYQLYGQSETVPATMLLPHQHRPHGSEDDRRRLRSVGRATPNTVITIVDDDGHPLPQGEAGEIAVLSPGAMKELWRDPEGTAARRLADGSVLTRDIGYLDAEGFLHLVDRKEDMIVSGGYNIWPSELEEALSSHPAVLEVCVVGAPHPRWGETPRAVVVLRPGAAATEEELVEHCRAAVGAVRKVTGVDFVDELPRSGIGKVLRRSVRERYWVGHERRIAGA